MNEKEELFRDAPIPRAVGKMALPCVISSLVLIIYNMADTFFVGQTKDALQVAAVSLTNPVFVMFMAVANLLGIGGSAMISILMGKGEEKQAKAVSAFCCYASLGVGLVFAALIILFMEPLLHVLGSSQGTYTFARDYLFWIALGAPFILFANTFGHVVRGEGAAAASMIGGMIGTVVNIVLDPLSILTFGMGTGGAAIATVLGNVCGGIYYLWYFSRGKSVLSLHPGHLAGQRQLMVQTALLGVPSGMNSALMSIANVLQNNVLAVYGDDQLAAMVFYPEDRADHTFSLYWNRPGPSAGWFFRAGGSITPLQEGVVRFTLEGCGEVAYGSLNRPGVSQVVVDDGSDPRVLSLDPEKPFALVLPRNAGTVTFYDREGRVVEPHQEIL